MAAKESGKRKSGLENSKWLLIMVCSVLFPSVFSVTVIDFFFPFLLHEMLTFGASWWWWRNQRQQEQKKITMTTNNLKAGVLTRLLGGALTYSGAERPVFSADVLAMCEKQISKSSFFWQEAKKQWRGKKICHSGRASVGRLSPFLLSNLSRRCRWMQGAQGGDKRRHDGYYPPPQQSADTEPTLTSLNRAQLHEYNSFSIRGRCQLLPLSLNTRHSFLSFFKNNRSLISEM